MFLAFIYKFNCYSKSLLFDCVPLSSRKNRKLNRSGRIGAFLRQRLQEVTGSLHSYANDCRKWLDRCIITPTIAGSDWIGPFLRQRLQEVSRSLHSYHQRLLKMIHKARETDENSFKVFCSLVCWTRIWDLVVHRWQEYCSILCIRVML